jgi:signal transduction histidine kinase
MRRGAERAGQPVGPSLRLDGLGVGHWHAITAGVLVVIALTTLVVGLRLIDRQSAARNELLDRVAPTGRDVLRLGAALTDQETGVRGYLLTARPAFLQPYALGRRDENAAMRRLRRLTSAGRTQELRAGLRAVSARALEWRTAYAEPAIARTRRGDRTVRAAIETAFGKQRFDRVRAAVSGLRTDIAGVTARARDRLETAARGVRVTFAILGAILLLSILAGAALLRQTVTRPLTRLGHGARLVAAGDLSRSLDAGGPSDIRQLAADVEVMRARLVDELAAADRARAELLASSSDLRRSNTELERFAYVISHDLQEPLRKVAGFCDLLQSRYAGRLDARADEYIGYAVDGATRMQRMIDDLLTLSRAGRAPAAVAVSDLGALAEAARSRLQQAIADNDADVQIGALPTVRADPAQVTTVFEQLIDNAIKFRSAEPPVVRIGAERRGDEWLISCTDNGIGVPAAQAERVFGVFEQLGPRGARAGSGIGLAMCRTIVEKHGGRIWIEQREDDGTRIVFSLPCDDDAMHGPSGRSDA